MAEIEKLYKAYFRWQKSAKKQFLDDPLFVEIDENLKELFYVLGDKLEKAGLNDECD